MSFRRYIKLRQCYFCGGSRNCNVVSQCCFCLIQCENASLKEQIESINKELEITKEKLHTIEQAWEQEIKLGKYYGYDNIKWLSSNSEYFSFKVLFLYWMKRKYFDKNEFFV